MKQRKLIFLSVFILVISSVACSIAGCRVVGGSGRVVEEERQVSGFSEVSLTNSATLYIENGDEEALRIEAEDNLLPYLETYVSGDTLVLDTRRGISLHPTQPIKFYLTVKELDSINVSGSGDVFAPDMQGWEIYLKASGSGGIQSGALAANTVNLKTTGSGDIETGIVAAQEINMNTTGSGDFVIAGGKTEKLDVSVSGAAKVNLGELEAEQVKVKITGSGKMTVSDGDIDRQDVTLTGSGAYHAGDMHSSRATVSNSSSGEITVQVQDQLEATLTGSGDVYYIGSPTVEQQVSGSGGVHQIEE